jgi:hypothetical protein
LLFAVVSRAGGVSESRVLHCGAQRRYAAHRCS